MLHGKNILLLKEPELSSKTSIQISEVISVIKFHSSSQNQNKRQKKETSAYMPGFYI